MVNKIYVKLKVFIKEYLVSLLIIGFFAFFVLFEFDYVVYTPGGIVPLDKRVDVSGGYTYDGSINMSYVTMRKGTLANILLSYCFSNWDLIKESDVVINDESMEDLMKLEKLQMKSSVDNATMVAYKKADKSIEVSKYINHIIYISDDASTDLELFDELISVDGINITSIDKLKKIVNSKNEGDSVSLVVKRGKKDHECMAQVYKVGDELKIGVAFLTTYDYETDPNIDIKTKSSESGSSGGLMMSLAIYNSLVKEDITKGKVVVGTGTIDQAGNVGEIDGIKYKLLGASKKHADIFLCPVENYEEAISVKEKLDLDLDIRSVSTFDEALDVLERMQ